MSNYGLYFKKIRNDRGLTQKDLASILKVNLSSIKRLEVGRNSLPNSKLLNNLATFIGKSKVDVLEDILFWNNPKCQEDSYKFGCNFLSYQYLNGWNFEFQKEYSVPESNQKDTYLALIAKKTKSMQCLVKTFDDSTKLYQNIKSGKAVQLVFDQILSSTNIKELKSMHNYIYLFNNQKESEVKTFNTLKELYFEGVKLSIKIVLYDASKNTVIDQSQLTGRSFLLRDTPRSIKSLINTQEKIKKEKAITEEPNEQTKAGNHFTKD